MNNTAQLLHWPRPAAAMWAVYWRNFLVWKKLAFSSLVGNIAEPLIVLVALGYGLGHWIGHIDGVPYILFFASGSVCMSAMNATSFEALYSAFSRMHVQKTWDGLLNAPVSLDDIVMAEMLWAATKGLMSATALVCVLFALGISREPLLLLAIPALALVGLTFAALALILNALAKGYDFFTYYFTLFLMPMTFLSGVYFPLHTLPETVAAIAQLLPLTHAVELIRPLVWGQWPQQPLLHIAVLAAYAIGGYIAAVYLTRRRFCS